MAYTKPQERKKEEKGYKERDIRSSLLILDLKDGKWQDSGKSEEGKTFHHHKRIKINFLGRS